GEMKGPARADVEGKLGKDAPVVLNEIFFDVIAGTNFAALEIDLEGIDLAEKEAGEGVAGAGDALLVSSGGGERERAGRMGRRDGVELIPAKIGPGFDCVLSVGEENGVGQLPDGGLILREGAGRGAQLLEPGKGEERER